MKQFSSSLKKDDQKTLQALRRARKAGIRMSVVGAGGLSVSPEDLEKSKEIKRSAQQVEALFSFS